MAQKILLSAFVLSFILFFPSLFNFFSHDDFFHLNISRAKNIGDFLNFFNLVESPKGFGFYRPLTTQVFYFVFGWSFGLNPLIMHLVSYAVFFANIFLVYILSKKIFDNLKIASIAAFLYAVSPTHFGHLYFLGTFQELGLAFFYFLSLILFISFIETKNMKEYLLVVLAFVGALLSKEFAVTLPFSLLLIYIYKRGLKNLNFIFIYITPLLIILLIYLWLHVFFYGLAAGDSYHWEFSVRVVNTIFWYLLWSLGLPEMIVDYIGPGVKVNPNLLQFYGSYILPITLLFIIQSLILVSALMRSFKNGKSLKVLFFGVSLFILTLTPVLFLPLHKFAYELTVPLYGIVVFISYLLIKSFSSKIVTVFLIIYFSLSFCTVLLTYKTHWIVQGGMVAKKVYLLTKDLNNKPQVLVFYNSVEDKDLPWKPADQLKIILSGDNFTEVFYPATLKFEFKESSEEGKLNIRARDILYD